MSEQQKDSPLEQLARRFETYAEDNEAMSSRRYFSPTERRTMRDKAVGWRQAAKELREIELDLTSKGLTLLMCSAATGLPVAE